MRKRQSSVMSEPIELRPHHEPTSRVASTPIDFLEGSYYIPATPSAIITAGLDEAETLALLIDAIRKLTSCEQHTFVGLIRR
jgi:hypothetical protein